MRRGRLLKTLKKILKMETYKDFLFIFFKSIRLPQLSTQSFRTLWRRTGSFLSPAGKPGFLQPELSVAPGSRRAVPQGEGLEAAFPGEAAGRAVPRARSPAGGEERYRPLRPHKHSSPRPSPPRIWTRGPARAHSSSSEGHLGSRSPGSGRLAGSLLPTASASGSGPAAGEPREPSEERHGFGQGDSGTPQ